MSVQASTIADWVAVDWGTSNARVWAMGPDGRDFAHGAFDKGMGALSPGDYETTLLDMIEPWLGNGVTDVMICGMAGSRQGWIEAGYAPVPAKPVGGGLARPATTDPRLNVYILPGLSQASPPDVMRGEETQLAGFLSINPKFDGVICLPGTHCKWVHVSAGEVVSFRTFITGELFATIGEHTVLRHSMGEGWDEAAFDAGVDDTLSRPEMLAARLFSIRADGLLNGTSADAATSRLSGLLIGAEIAAAKPYWLGQNVAIIGASKLSSYYARALESQGALALRASVDDVTKAGLRAAYQTLKENTE